MKEDVNPKMNFSADKRLLVIFRRLHLPSQLSCTDLISPFPLPAFPQEDDRFSFQSLLSQNVSGHLL